MIWIETEFRPDAKVIPVLDTGLEVDSRVLPSRRLEQQPVKFDPLSPSEMGVAHGRIAEMPPVAILQRMIGHDTWEDHSLFFLGIKHNMDHDPNFGFSSMGLDISLQGKAYAETYTKGLRAYMQEHGVKPEDLKAFNPDLLTNAGQMDAFLDGFERVPYTGAEIMREGLRNFVRTAPNPVGYRLGFAVGVSRDFDLPISFTGVPKNDPEYNAFLEGLSGVKIPREFGSLAGRIPELRSFQLGNRIHEIVDAEPLSQAA